MKQLDVVNAGLKDDSGNAELLALKSELDDAIGLLEETLAELKPAKATPKPKSPSPPPVQEKWSRENHPAFKKAAPPPEEKEPDQGPVNYKVNDNVMAKWLTGDRGFYPARITSITGSSTDPIYIVKFKSYDTTEQLRSRDIRPVAQKRKADGTPTSGAAASSSAGFSPYRGAGWRYSPAIPPSAKTIHRSTVAFAPCAAHRPTRALLPAPANREGRD